MTASGATRGCRSLLTVNAGSSSLKAGVYDLGCAETGLLSAQVERIGLPGSRLRLSGPGGELLVERPEDLPDHEAALQTLLAELRRRWPDHGLAAVGHRVVHGGAAYAQPHLITAALMAELRHVVPLAPNHLPPALAGIQAVAHAAFLEELELAAEAGVGFVGVKCGRATWQEGIPIYARHGLAALEAWLTDQGVKRIEAFNALLATAARPWRSTDDGRDRIEVMERRPARSAAQPG